MRFIHTADWHLGRSFHNFSLVEDQSYALEQVIDLAKDSRPEAILIAGDIYDRAVPPPEAVSLLDHFLGEVVAGLGIPIIAISGNHDSGERLNFGSRLLARSGCHVFGRLTNRVEAVTLEDEHGPVHFIGLPYAEPAIVRDRTGAKDLHNHDQAMAYLTGAAANAVPKGHRSVLLAHCFVSGATESDSERPLSVGGAGAVPKDLFKPFSYTALGHLHRPQNPTERASYAGSLLKYSFSEIGHQKSVSVVELTADGAVSIERTAIRPRRDVRMIDGALKDLLKGPGPKENSEDYLLVRLQDKQHLLDPMGRLREIYPNVLHIERPGLERAAREHTGGASHELSERDLFSAFFEQVTGETLTKEQEKVFLKTLEELQARERESAR